MIKRILLIATITILIFQSCNKKEKIYTIGVCEFIDSPTSKESEEGFFKAFKDGNIIPDKDLKIEVLNAHGDFPTVNSIIKKYVGNKVDMIFCIGTPSLQNALNSTSEIPIVFTSVANPTMAGVTDNDKNVTGISTTSPFAETVAIIRELLPEAKHLGTIWTPAESNSEFYKNRAEEEAQKAGFSLTAMPINSSSEMNDAVKVLIGKKIDAFYQISDNLTNSAFETEVKLADQHQVPIFCNQTSEVKRGAAVGLGWDFFDGGYEAGKIAIRIFKGEKPADIPIKNLSKVALTINKAAADRQNLDITKEVLDRANNVINN